VNLPNRLTLARIILIPVFMAFLLLKIPKGHEIFPHQDVVAAIIFILAAATDGLDGYIARKRHLVTNLGKFMDPLADKLLVSAALISLVQLGEVMAWVGLDHPGKRVCRDGTTSYSGCGQSCHQCQ